jgi:hypothetical protein
MSDDKEPKFEWSDGGHLFSSNAPLDFKLSPELPILTIKTPNGVTRCRKCNQYAMAEHWVKQPGTPEYLLGEKCLWCGHHD